MSAKLKLLLLAPAFCLLTACGSTGTATDGPATDAPVETASVAADAADSGGAEAEASPAPPPEEIEYGNFTEEQLYQAIISEISGQRGDLREAGDNYLDLALATEDLSIIRRAVQFASANGDTNALLQLGLLWSQVAPEDPRPHMMLSFEFLENGNFEQALSHMVRVLDLGGEVDFTALTARTAQLSPLDRSRLIGDVRALTREFPEQESLRLTLVQLLAQNRNYADALTELRSLVEGGEFSPMLVVLEAQILQADGDTEGALRVLREGSREFPADPAVRQSYARLLVQEERFREARAEFQALVDQQEDDWETWYSIALLDLELERYGRAGGIFERLIEAGERVDESRYYLGFVYQEQGEPDRAIQQLRQVRIGTNNYLAAQQQATQLAIAEGRLDEAHAWLVNQSQGQPRLEVLFTTIESAALIQAGHSDRARELLDLALNKYPNEVDLLFARVLLNDSEGNRAASERDLRQIISMRPEDSRALNHLGYMLADQTERFDEALELLEQAIALEPDDPAIIDSLGWAQYKLGMYEEALANLRRAYAAFPDHEVASHLGEVLWQMGREDEALDVWDEGLETRPDSELILGTMERLGAD